ncbi:MAG: tetratricopeptide repeat protein [Acidimicrobiales bacterium]
MITDRPRLDPDELAALEEQRDFLLRSIDDLDREHDAGDLADHDHQALRDTYTTQAAEVLRAIDERRHAFAAVRSRPRAGLLRAVAVVVVVGMGAVLAGLLVARTSGGRAPGDPATGADGVRLTATQEATRCIDLTARGEATEAIACYRKVLDGEPTNPTALTYLGWTLVLSSQGLPPATATEALTAAEGLLARAVAADPAYPDARAFRAIVAERQERLDDARAELDALDALDPPPDIRALTEALRRRLSEDGAGAASTATTGPPG